MRREPLHGVMLSWVPFGNIAVAMITFPRVPLIVLSRAPLAGVAVRGVVVGLEALAGVAVTVAGLGVLVEGVGLVVRRHWRGLGSCRTGRQPRAGIALVLVGPALVSVGLVAEGGEMLTDVLTLRYWAERVVLLGSHSTWLQFLSGSWKQIVFQQILFLKESI